MNEITELSKKSITVKEILSQRTIREECKSIGFNYDDNTNDAIYLLKLNECLKIEGNISHWVKRLEDGFVFYQGNPDEEYSRHFSKTNIKPYKEKQYEQLELF